MAPSLPAASIAWKIEQQRPAILGVEHVLHLRERLDADLQRLLGPRLVFGSELERVARVEVPQPERLSVGDAEWFREAVGFPGEIVQFHSGSFPV